MYPILFEIFGYEVSSFGVLMVVGLLVGTWITGVRLGEHGRDPDLANRMLIWCAAGASSVRSSTTRRTCRCGPTSRSGP